LIIIHIILLAIIALGIYSNILHSPFQLDDLELLLGDPNVRSPHLVVESYGVRKFFTFITFSLNYVTSGQNPFFYHLVNIFLHIFCGWLVYFSVLKIFYHSGQALRQGSSTAFIAGLVFVTHPLQTESVTYIWQRTEIFSALFYLACFLCYLHARADGKKIFYPLGLGLFWLGLQEKGTIVSLPVMILATETLIFEQPRLARWWRVIGGVFVGWIIFVLLPFSITRGIVETLHVWVAEHTGLQFSMSYLLTQTVVWLKYIQLAVLPFGQNIEPDVRLVKNIFEPNALAAFCFLLVICLGAVRLCRSNKIAAFGIFWFFIGLLPSSFIMREPMWEHRVYLSLAGYGIFLAAIIVRAVKSSQGRAILVAAIVLFLSVLTIARNSLWRSPTVLLEDAVKKSPFKARPHLALGMQYLNAGRTEEAWKMFERAMRLAPEFADPYNNIGVILARKRKYTEAIPYFEKAAQLRPDFVLPYLNLGEIYIYTYFPDYPKAMAYFQKVLLIEPNNLTALRQVADIYRLNRDYSAALATYQKIVKSNPLQADAYFRMGEIYFRQSDFNSALTAFERCRQLAPDNIPTYKALVAVAQKMGDHKTAARYQEQMEKVRVKWLKEKKK